MIQIGVIGTGGMGGRHARNLATKTPDAKVVAIMDVDLVRAEAVAAECGRAKVYSKVAAIVADPDVQALVIASPDPFHAETVLVCLEAGKPVLCEKPLATNMADAKKVLDAELAGGRRLVQLGFMREYDAAHQALKELLDRGDIGQALMFHGIHTGEGLAEPRTIEDVIINSAVHDIHSARWLLNQEIAQVYTQWVRAEKTRPETCRLLLVQMVFRDGTLGLIEMNADSNFGYQVDVALTGSQGSARTAPASAPTVKQARKQFQTIDPDWLVRFEAAYIRETQVWVQSLIEEQPTRPSVWDGYMAMVVADACIQSAKMGQPQTVPDLERPAMYAR
jgi:myo-inositol 2-dehydrogenase/D-chiro-inositol 1-dehydrogenase